MNKLLLAATVACSLSFGVLCGGCGHNAQDTSKEWSPAKMGMTHDQFAAYASQQMKLRANHQPPLPAPAGGPKGPASN